MPPIHVMIKPVSGACNLRCRYCFYADEASHRATASYGVMTGEIMETLIRKAFLYADNTVFFSFQGGEPTLAGVEFYRSFLRTVSRYNTRGLSVSYALQTNGVGLSEELCTLLSDNGFLVGVSLDGTKETHDAFRVDIGGAPTHDRVLRGISLLQKYQIPFNGLCVVTQPLAESFPAVWRALAPYGHIQFIPCIDGFEGTATPMSLQPGTYGQMLVECFDLYRAAFFTSAPVRERRMDNYLSILLGYPPEACGMTGSCGLYFLCEADGSIFPCDFYALDEWKLGNICENSFLRLFQSDRMQRFQSEGKHPPAACASCRYFPLCRGGCRRDREPSLTANRFCKSYRYFFDNRLTELRDLARKVAKRM